MPVSITTRTGALSRRLLQFLIVVACTLSSPEYAQTGSEVPSLVIRGARIVTVSGPAIDNGTIVIANGLITSVGTDPAAPQGARIIDAKGLSVYPGLIDSFTDIGISSSPPAGSSAATPWRILANELNPNDPRVEQWRSGGFTSVMTAPTAGIFSGQGAVIDLEPTDRDLKVQAPVALVLRFQPARWPSEFPNSLMGLWAYLRQAFVDATEFEEAKAANKAETNRSVEPANHQVLTAIGETLHSKRPILFPANSATHIRRVLRFSAALGIQNPVVYGGQEGYSAATELAMNKVSVLVSVKWPREELDPDPEESESLRTMRFREMAPHSPAALQAAGVRFAFYSDGLPTPGEVLAGVRQAVDAGLPGDAAVRALTLSAAEIFGVQSILGSIEPGKRANLIVTDGDLLGDQTRIAMTIVGGRVYEQKAPLLLSATVRSSPSTSAGKLEAQPVMLARDGRPTFIANATILTITNGTIQNGSILIREGKIAEVGKGLKPPPDARVIDASGQFVMPGIIDCHSHIAIEGTWYESSVTVGSMASVVDVLNPDDINIYRTLAGGVTAANILYSSFNAIGGQTVVIKLRWGEPASGLIFQGAPPGIKFALGENPKRGNGAASTSVSSRYPKTRMGVIDIIRQAFVEAIAYKRSWDDYKRRATSDHTSLPPHRDLKLEPLVEVLEGKRLVHVHSYRADGILSLLRVADEFGFKVATLQHAIEGYKIADEIARHGVGASTFSDWWAYKFEAYDAIPYNAAVMTRHGIVVSINSDSAEEAHHLNQEAAKSIKWGGLSETEALKLITLNPAIQLGIDSRVGSIEVGKDADLSIWNAHPLSVFAVAQKVLIDGRIFFDRQQDRLRRVEVDREKKVLRERKSVSKGSTRKGS